VKSPMRSCRFCLRCSPNQKKLTLKPPTANFQSFLVTKPKNGEALSKGAKQNCLATRIGTSEENYEKSYINSFCIPASLLVSLNPA
jgi:hypothetical protein